MADRRSRMEQAHRKFDYLQDIGGVAGGGDHEGRRCPCRFVDSLRPRADDHLEGSIIIAGTKANIPAILTHVAIDVGESGSRLVHLSAAIKQVGQDGVSVTLDAAATTTDLPFDGIWLDPSTHLIDKTSRVEHADA